MILQRMGSPKTQNNDFIENEVTKDPEEWFYREWGHWGPKRMVLQRIGLPRTKKNDFTKSWIERRPTHSLWEPFY